jgi:hypothetical protein
MASAAGSLTLEAFNKNGIIDNEGVKVQLKDEDDVKKFAVADQPDLVASEEKLV